MAVAVGGAVEGAVEGMGPTTQTLLVGLSTKDDQNPRQQCLHKGPFSKLIHLRTNVLHLITLPFSSRSRECRSCRLRIVSCVDFGVAAL